MQQNLNQLLTSISSSTPSKAQLYLLHSSSDNAALIDYVVRQIKAPLTAATKEVFYVDRYFDYAVVRDLLSNISLFTAGTYIELNYKTKPTVAQQHDLLSIVAEIPDGICIVITTDKLSKAELSSKWVSKISAVGRVTALYENDVETIAKHMLVQENFAINDAAMSLLLQQNVGNPTQLLQEINKFMLLYAAGHTITIDEVKEHSFVNAQYNIYQLSNAYLQADLALALDILDNIFQQGEDGILITWMLTEDVRKLLMLKAKMLKEKMSFNQAVKELNIWGSNTSVLGVAVSRLSYATLIEVFDMLATLDMISKGVVTDTDAYAQLVGIIRRITTHCATK